MHIRARSKGPLSFSCSVDSVSDAFDVLLPSFLPDLYDGRIFSDILHLPISNLMSKKSLKNIRISIAEQPDSTRLKLLSIDSLGSISPGQIRPIMCRLTSEEEYVIRPCGNVYIKLKISTSEGQVIFGLTLGCRKATESVVFTFIDDDGSLQYAAAIRPLEDCDRGRGIFSLKFRVVLLLCLSGIEF